jgi:hypothetical protein
VRIGSSLPALGRGVRSGATGRRCGRGSSRDTGGAQRAAPACDGDRDGSVQACDRLRVGVLPSAREVGGRA